MHSKNLKDGSGDYAAGYLAGYQAGLIAVVYENSQRRGRGAARGGRARKGSPTAREKRQAEGKTEDSQTTSKRHSKIEQQ